MRVGYLVLALAVVIPACSSLRVSCDVRLHPINTAPPAPDPGARGAAPTPKGPISADRSASEAKP